MGGEIKKVMKEILVQPERRDTLTELVGSEAGCSIRQVFFCPPETFKKDRNLSVKGKINGSSLF